MVVVVCDEVEMVLLTVVVVMEVVRLLPAAGELLSLILI